VCGGGELRAGVNRNSLLNKGEKENKQTNTNKRSE
jgi:hypothetical protein